MEGNREAGGGQLGGQCMSPSERRQLFGLGVRSGEEKNK